MRLSCRRDESEDCCLLKNLESTLNGQAKADRTLKAEPVVETTRPFH
jgi:hypothetical protein